MRKIIALLFALIVVTPAIAADAIEGTVWKIKLTATDGGKDFADVLHFKGSLFTDDELAKKGFMPANIDENTTRFGPATFEVKAESKTDGSVKWNGSISADQMTGTLVWTKADGSTLNYSFTGERTSK